MFMNTKSIGYWLVITKLMTVSANLAGVCNLTESCGSQISKEECDKRDCCYVPSNLTTFNCVQKYNANFLQPTFIPNSNNNEGDMLPTDAIPSNIDKYLDASQPEQLNAYLKEIGAKSTVNWKISKKNVFDAVIKVEPDSFTEEVTFESGTKIEIQPSQKNISFIVLTEYLTLADILRNKSEKTSANKIIYESENITCPPKKKLMENATIISVTAFNQNATAIPVSVKFSFDHLNTKELNDNTSVSCEYLNETSSHWSADGCFVINTGPTSITCGCNHTTKFSVLFVVHPLPFEVEVFHLSNIQIIEFVMEGLSLVCLFITFLSLVIVLQRRSKSSTSASARAQERTVVHINFVAALFALHLTRLASEAAFADGLLCILTVIFSHYFMLASGTWMLIEGIVLYLTVILKSMKHAKLGWYKFAAGWGVPVIIVAISAGIGLTKQIYIQKLQRWECVYENNDVHKELIDLTFPYEYCWLSINSNMIWTASGPLLAIFAINLFILSHTVCFVLKLSIKSDSLKPSGYKAQNGQHIWNTTKGILILFPILGVPWLIGFLVNIPHYQVSLSFRYIHVTLNGLQGVFIFILYSAVNKEVRDTLKRVLKTKWQQHKISISRSYNNSTQAAREKYKKSLTSLMGHNSSPTHKMNRYRPRTGSQFSQQSFIHIHRPSSASGSTNSTVLRYKRKYSTTSSEHVRLTVGPGYTGSLPRGWGYRSTPQVTRTPSTRSLRSDVSYGNNVQRVSCIVCGTSSQNKTCRHDVVHGINLEPGEPILKSYDFQDSIGPEPATNQRWHRMTAEEFKRFSAIPEEKRRSGVNSFILESGDGLSNHSHGWGKKAKTIERTNVSQKYGNKYCVTVDIHVCDDDIISSSSNDSTVASSSSLSMKTNLERSETLSNETIKPIYTNSITVSRNNSKYNDQTYNESENIHTKADSSPKPTKLSKRTPERSRGSEHMSTYSKQLRKAVEKWKAEAEKGETTCENEID